MIENFGKNFVFIAVCVFLIAGGVYLLFHGLQGLFKLEATDVCKSIRTQLRPDEKDLTGKELIALADQDLEYAQEFADKTVLIGREWLCVPKSMGQFIIRLENIYGIERRGTDSTGIHLKFVDQYACGPVTGALTSVDAGAIEMCLRNNAPNLKF